MEALRWPCVLPCEILFELKTLHSRVGGWALCPAWFPKVSQAAQHVIYVAIRVPDVPDVQGEVRGSRPSRADPPQGICGQSALDAAHVSGLLEQSRRSPGAAPATRRFNGWALCPEQEMLQDTRRIHRASGKQTPLLRPRAQPGLRCVGRGLPGSRPPHRHAGPRRVQASLALDAGLLRR